LFAPKRTHGLALERALADEVTLGLHHNPAEVGIIRCHRAIGVLADDDVALFRAQHVHCLGAIRANAVVTAGIEDRLPRLHAAIARHADFEA